MTLVGRGPNASHLFTNRGDYADFEIRVEARINHSGDSGVFFRSEHGASYFVEKFQKAVPNGYEAQICYVEQPAWKTGSLIGPDDAGEPIGLSPIPINVIRPDEWFTLAVTVRGNKIQLRIDGKLLVDYTDTVHRHAHGHIALQVFGSHTVVQYRKIEIKEDPIAHSNSQPL